MLAPFLALRRQKVLRRKKTQRRKICDVTEIHYTHHIVWAASSLLVCMLLGACSSARPAQTPTPAAYYPEQFPDIPLPQFYVRKPATDQVAVSFANGNLRMLDITLEETDVDSGAKQDTELLFWFDTMLDANGWKPRPTASLPSSARRYSKMFKGQEEVLELRTGRAHKLGIIHLRFLPQ